MINLRLGRKLLYSTVVSKSSTEAAVLNSAQVAFAHRLNIQKALPPFKLLQALSHPSLLKSSTDEPTTETVQKDFAHLRHVGKKSLSYFTEEYLTARFPALSEKYLRIGMDVFLADKNLLALARFLGIDAACGFDSKKQQLGKQNVFKGRRKQGHGLEAEEMELEKKTLQLDCFTALLGTLVLESGPLTVRNLLDSRYFNNSLFNPKDLVRPLYPIPDLSQKYPSLVFRLHQESGRASSNPMFIIGVYPDSAAKECLGEGFGPSQALAQHRAATDALRNIHLIEKRVTTRLSDQMTSSADIIYSV